MPEGADSCSFNSQVENLFLFHSGNNYCDTGGVAGRWWAKVKTDCYFSPSFTKTISVLRSGKRSFECSSGKKSFYGTFK